MPRNISVVIPIFNEARIIKELVIKLKEVAARLLFVFEFIFVNDGSSDDSLNILLDFAGSDKRIKIINLSSNFRLSTIPIVGVSGQENTPYLNPKESTA